MENAEKIPYGSMVYLMIVKVAFSYRPGGDEGRRKNLEPLKDALEELADFARKMEPTEYAYFYRLMERMENNVEICILVRDDRLEKLEAILRRDWNLVKRMYGDMWKMDLQNEKERYRFLQLLTEIEWYLEGKG